MTVKMPGFRDKSETDVSVNLGSDQKVDVKLELASVNEQVTVVAESPVIDTMRAGTAANVSTERWRSSQPCRAASKTSRARSPYFSDRRQRRAGTVLSVAGRNNRYNSIQIDGAVNNDLFGLSRDAARRRARPSRSRSASTPSKSCSCSCRPYDVRQGGFSGGGINAVTRSGTNALHGTGVLLGPFRRVSSGDSDRGEPSLPSARSARSWAAAASAVRSCRIARSSSAISKSNRRGVPSGFSVGGTRASTSAARPKPTASVNIAEDQVQLRSRAAC